MENLSNGAYIHVYAQSHWHQDAYIVGNREGLRRLRDALDRALGDDEHPPEVDTVVGAFCSDGEGYNLFVATEENPYIFNQLRMPYTDAPGSENIEGMAPYEIILKYDTLVDEAHNNDGRP